MVRNKTALCLLVTIFFVANFFHLQYLNAQGPKINVTAQPKKKAESTQEKAPGGKQPAISIEANQFDAGEVWEGDVVTHSFAVKNTGKAELAITNVKPG